MADKRISQLIERVDIANNDVLPIVASGATTTNKVTVSTLQDWMQDNLDVGVTSVGLTMPSAFQVSGSPITTSGNITVTATGTASQYIRGDGTLADFPQGGGGGGASVSYYLNGSVSQGTIGGVTYLEMNKTPVLGAGTDFTINANGYIASFITDAGDPGLLQIPGGNWNFETYFQASSGGGTPSFYVELYKVDSGGTATLIASNSSNPELIAFGTTTTAYFSTLAVPTTTLAITDRLAIRYYVTNAGRTITLHTENSNLCQIITTFTTGLTALNGLTAQVQNFATGTSGTDFNISSSGSIHTFNLPDASASARGVVTMGSQVFGGVKTFANGLSLSAVGGSNQTTRIVNIGTLHEGSASVNQIGFNSGNNIYFGKGLNNGGVISWNNAAVRYYTLPDADGTLALTSQIPANPVGGTGAAGRVAYWNGTGTITSDSLFQWNDTFKRLGIGRTPTVSLDVQGSQNISGTITAESTAGSGLRIYAGSGTNQWDMYLNSTNLRFSDNTGTGSVVFDRPLNGTSALFGSAYTAGGSVAINTWQRLGGAVSADITYNDANTSINFGTSTSHTLNIKTNNTTALSLASTGAATFSSSVTVGGGVGHKIELKDGAAWPTIRRNTSTGGIIFDTEGSSIAGSIFSVKTLNGSDFVTVTSGGNVGIGTSSPSTYSIAPNLVVDSGANGGGITIKTGTTASTSNYGFIGFADGTSGNEQYRGYIQYSHNFSSEVDALQFGTSGERRMTITAGGNVGIGTASPDTKLQVAGTGSTGFSVRANTSGDAFMRLYRDSTITSHWYDDRTNNKVTIGSVESIPFTFDTGGTERMRITSGGNTVLGGNAGSGWSTASGRTTLEIYGSSFPLAIHNSSSVGNSLSYNTYWDGSNWRYVGATYSVLYIQDGEGHKFFHNGAGTAGASFSPTERMRITSAGELLIGATSNSATSDDGSKFVSNGRLFQVSAYSDNTQESLSMYSTTASAYRFYVGWGGTIFATNTTISGISDARLKENIRDLDAGLDKIMALKPRVFDWKEGKGKDIKNDRGFIAQEFEKVFPDLIDEYKQEVEEGEEPYKSVRADLIPVLVKAMQEQQEQIKLLTEQVEALKSQING